MIIPSEWLPEAKIFRIICHWTAGAHTATAFDREHYHILINGDGKLVRGIPSIKLNEMPVKTGYAAHTLNCNSGSIGISLCCMAEARESPFNPGRYPMTAVQWEELSTAVADLCLFYEIPVSLTTILSHAEVQSNLGITQRGKWDYMRLAFDPSVVGARACGDKLRAAVIAKLAPPGGLPEAPPDPPGTPQVPLPDMVGRGQVTAASLNFRRSPNGEIVGSLPRGTWVTINKVDGDWLNVTTPAGYTGYVHGEFVNVP